MIKRTPQEIADFFQCYVVQASKYEGSSFRMSYDLPELSINEEHWEAKSWVDIPDELIEIPADHDWTHLYGPRHYSEKSADSDNNPDHLGEVYTEKEYCILGHGISRTLSRLVIKAMGEGWKPLGGVAVEHLPTSDGYAGDTAYFYQAMVRGL